MSARALRDMHALGLDPSPAQAGRTLPSRIRPCRSTSALLLHCRRQTRACATPWARHTQTQGAHQRQSPVPAPAPRKDRPPTARPTHPAPRSGCRAASCRLQLAARAICSRRQGQWLRCSELRGQAAAQRSGAGEARLSGTRRQLSGCKWNLRAGKVRGSIRLGRQEARCPALRMRMRG